MRILITSGGTKVPIDPVRNIRNMSSGRFGAEIATSALIAKTDVIYLTSFDGQSPFSKNINFYPLNDWKSTINQLAGLHELYSNHHHQYQEHRYNDFNEYAEKLESLVKTQKPDIIILAAAVSDYLVTNYSKQKVRSSEALSIQLGPAPKLIHSIKTWLPEVFLIGFKLLVDASEAELLKAAKINIEKHHLDLVIANDLSSIRRGTHEILIVEREGDFKKYSNHLADQIINRALRRWDK